MSKTSKVTSKSDSTKSFVKKFEKLCNMHNPFTVFTDFLTLAANSISNAVNPNDDREQEYMRIVNSYTKTEVEMFPSMLADVITEMQNDSTGIPRYRDVLGELFSELNLYDSWRGQFFTPQSVANMIGEIDIDKAEEIIKKRGYVSTLEPCIGGGALVIGLVNAMFQHGLNPCKQLLVTACDIDIRCIHMSYIHLSLMGIPAILQHKDTLSNNILGDTWYTPIFILDDWAGRLRTERLVKVMKNFLAETETATAEVPAPAEIVETPVKPVQLSLF